MANFLIYTKFTIMVLIVCICRTDAGGQNSDCPSLPNWPSNIPVSLQTFENWATALCVPNLWTAVPSNAGDVVTLSNWALANGYQLRASGFMHTWSPLTVTQTGNNCTNTILVKTTTCLNEMKILSGNPASVLVQTGASMNDLLAFLEDSGYGVMAVPAPGDLTVGGVLAIDGHGTALRATGETLPPGKTYGSLSNLIQAFTAVVWNSTTSTYQLKSFKRSDWDAFAFMTHLGRTFLTDVTLSIGTNTNIRCQSIVNIPASELFANPANTTGRTVSSFLQSSGRIEIILFPFTTCPWLKVWTISPTCPLPLVSRPATGPYNYPFSDNIPPTVATLYNEIAGGNWSLAPTLGALQYTLTTVGLTATLSSDICGPSKNTLLYVKPTTVRATFNGYAILTTMSNVQNVVYQLYNFYSAQLVPYQNAGLYPVNMGMEVRFSGLDSISGLSSLSPIAAYPQYNVAVWYDILTIPNTAYSNQFYAEFESFVFTTFDKSECSVGLARPEWSKGFAYTNDNPWANSTMMTYFKSLYDNWDSSVNILKSYDPNGIFTNDFLDTLLV